MPPASSPALSWSLPRVGEIVSACETLNDSGSAPYLSAPICLALLPGGVYIQAVAI